MAGWNLFGNWGDEELDDVPQDWWEEYWSSETTQAATVMFAILVLGTVLFFVKRISAYMFDAVKFVILWTACMLMYEIARSFFTPSFVVEVALSVFRVAGVSVPIAWNISIPEL